MLPVRAASQAPGAGRARRVREGAVAGWETAVLAGGPEDGLRVRVAGQPMVLQVVRPCPAEDAPDGVLVQALYVYRREPGEPLRYGYDPVSP
ncbi:hypothetical protein ACFP1Z_22350 [Streptomyces gamaensis]|uniref:UTRA domain-containing protein n=1 Tax=Streptomyces gamaensis TaxID=1763542 RepID=A0ABW0Z446_9ACTN